MDKNDTPSPDWNKDDAQRIKIAKTAARTVFQTTPNLTDDQRADLTQRFDKMASGTVAKVARVRDAILAKIKPAAEPAAEPAAA